MEYWSSGVLEYWARNIRYCDLFLLLSNTPSLQHSITPIKREAR